MWRFKALSRAGWLVIGVVATLILVPTVAVAATVAYNGIEGTNGTTTTQNKALVTSAGQLLTTEVQPSEYVEYGAAVYTAQGQNGGLQCNTAIKIPSGKGFIAQQVELDAYEADAPSSYSNPNGAVSGSGFSVWADPPSEGGNCEESLVTAGEAPGGTIGNTTIPLVPGFVIPTGYSVDIEGHGVDAVVYISGYLVPSADASSSPTETSRQALPRR